MALNGQLKGEQLNWVTGFSVIKLNVCAIWDCLLQNYCCKKY